MAEISDAELARLQQVEFAFNKALGNTKTRAAQQKIFKEVDPAYQTDEDRNRPFVEEAEARAKKVLEDHLTKEKNDKLEADFQSKLNALRLSTENPDGYTDEGIEKIKQLMRDRTIPDPEAAAALFEKQNPQRPEPPSGVIGTGWNNQFGPAGQTMTDEDRKLLFNDPDAWSDREAQRVWNEEVRKQS